MRLILEKFTRFDPDSFSLILRLENTGGRLDDSQARISLRARELIEPGPFGSSKLQFVRQRLGLAADADLFAIYDTLLPELQAAFAKLTDALK